MINKSKKHLQSDIAAYSQSMQCISAAVTTGEQNNYVEHMLGTQKNTLLICSLSEMDKKLKAMAKPPTHIGATCMSQYHGSAITAFA